MRCRQCDAEIDPLEVFPGTTCLGCFETDPQTRREAREMTAEKLAKMWSAD